MRKDNLVIFNPVCRSSSTRATRSGRLFVKIRIWVFFLLKTVGPSIFGIIGQKYRQYMNIYVLQLSLYMMACYK